MIQLRIENYNIILIEKQQKHHQLYCQVKMINMDILQSDQSRITKQEKFVYSLIGKALEKQVKTIEKQGKKQVDDIANQK